MRTYQHPIYQDNTMAIRAEYDEEKRVFDLMKKFLYIVGAITAIVVFLLLLVNSPALITQTGAIGIIALVPVLLAATLQQPLPGFTSARYRLATSLHGVQSSAQSCSCGATLSDCSS